MNKRQRKKWLKKHNPSQYYFQESLKTFFKCDDVKKALSDPTPYWFQKHMPPNQASAMNIFWEPNGLLHPDIVVGPQLDLTRELFGVDSSDEVLGVGTITNVDTKNGIITISTARNE